MLRWSLFHGRSQLKRAVGQSMTSGKPLVVDNGTGFVKCGFAGDNFPVAIFPRFRYPIVWPDWRCVACAARRQLVHACLCMHATCEPSRSTMPVSALLPQH